MGIEVFQIIVMKVCKFSFPSLSVRQKLVKEIEILETKIATAQNVIENAAANKEGF